MEKNNTEKKNTKLSLSSILENNRILMILSIIIAFIIWMWVAIDKSPEVQTVITGVPVKINLENSIPKQLGLQIFGESSFTVDVTVSGKKYITSTLTADDILVEANTNYVDSPGIKTLQLKVSSANDRNDFKVSGSSANYIEVYFDTYKEIDMPLKGELTSTLDSKVPEGCILGDLVCSTASVKISGPASEINRVTEVIATASVDAVLEKTTTFDPSIKLITNDGSQLEYSKVNTEDTITMTAPVLKVVTLPTGIDFRNAPSYFVANPLQFSVSPATVTVAIPIETVGITKTAIVDTIDFADIINSYNSFTVDASSITNFKLMDSTIKRFRVSVNASAFEARTFTVPYSSITLANSRDDFKVALEGGRNASVTLIGTAEALEAVTAEDIKIRVDTADKTINPDTTALQATVTVPDEKNCWVYGKYDIMVSVKAAEQ